LVIGSVFFGTEKFLHALLAVMHLNLNFTLIPMLYFMFADDDIKGAISRKQYKEALKLLLGVKTD